MVDASNLETESLQMKDPRRQMFARRLQEAMDKKDWHAAELGRRAGVQRQAVSSYLRADSIPSPGFLKKIAAALGVDPEVLLPGGTKPVQRMNRGHLDESAPGEQPLAMRIFPSDQEGFVWLNLHQLVTVDQAQEIMRIVMSDKPKRHAASNRK